MAGPAAIGIPAEAIFGPPAAAAARASSSCCSRIHSRSWAAPLKPLFPGGAAPAAPNVLALRAELKEPPGLLEAGEAAAAAAAAATGEGEAAPLLRTQLVCGAIAASEIAPAGCCGPGAACQDVHAIVSHAAWPSMGAKHRASSDALSLSLLRQR